MEKIRINGIDKKDSGLVIVKYHLPNGDSNRPPLEATLNTKWQSQEVFYLEKEVGIGGEVSVLIENKQNADKTKTYINITKVDFKSAVPNPASCVLKEVQQGERSLNGQEQKSVKDEKFRTPAEMIATELVKAVIGQKHPKDVNDMFTIGHAVNMYKEALELLG